MTRIESMAENTPAVNPTQVPSQGVIKEGGYDPKREDYQTRQEGNYVIVADPLQIDSTTGLAKEVRRFPKVAGGAGEPEWILQAQVEKPPALSEFELAVDRQKQLAKVDRNKLPVDPAQGIDRQAEYDALVRQNEREINDLINDANNSGALRHFYGEISQLYREVMAESTSRYRDEHGAESRRTYADRITMVHGALDNYQERFWDYNDPNLSGLQARHKGVATYLAPKVALALEKVFKGVALSPTEIGDRLIESIRTREDERLNEQREKNPFWDRSWGRIVLTGRTPEEIVKGIDHFLQVATSESSTFTPDQMRQDAYGLNEEIQRTGRQMGMEEERISSEVARAQGTLLVNVSDHFAVRWNVPEWHQITSEIGKHINIRLNAIAKAHEAEVMHAADILDNDEEYDKFSRPAEFLSDPSGQNDEVLWSDRAKERRRLEVRIALSQLKDIDTVIRENFVGIETQIDGFGFDRNAIDPVTNQPLSVTRLFQNSQYLDEIKRINDKLKALNQKDPQTVTVTDQLTDIEKKMLILDRIRPYQKTEELVVIDQTDRQFRSLYTEYAGFGSKAGYDAKVAELWLKHNNNEQLSETERQFLARDELLKKLEDGGKLTEKELRMFPEISRARQAVDLAIKTRDVFFISAEKAGALLITKHEIPGKGKGELLAYNDVVRLNKFVRERAIASLPETIAKAITSATKEGAGLRYVDIADKLEFRKISNKVISDKGKDSELGKNAQESLRLITLTEEEQQYATYVQTVEDIQEKVLEKLKEKGSDLTVADIDGIIQNEIIQSQLPINFASRQAARDKQVLSVHKGETQKRASVGYRDIINREDADPQYNFSMTDDQNYSSLLMSQEITAAAYNSDHPHYNTYPARTRRLIDPDNTLLKGISDPDEKRKRIFRAQETQRRFCFAVDSVKVFGAFYQPDLYKDGEVEAEYVENRRNTPFIGRRMIEQRFWTLWNRGQAARGRGFLKYLESNFRGLDHSIGSRGLRGIISTYNGFRTHGFDYEVDFSGAMDELQTERWLEAAKGAEAVRPVLIGGQVGQNPNFEGIFKKIVKTIGRNNYTLAQSNSGLESESSSLWLMSKRKWDKLEAGDYEKAIDEIENRWERVTIYGNSLAFVGTASQVPLAAKFSGDTAIRRMAYWAVAHPEGQSVYNINMPLIRAVLEPFTAKTPLSKQENYFGQDGTLLTELMRRAILAK